MNTYWLVGGNFNCITHSAEKTSGRPPNLAKMNIFSDNILKAGFLTLVIRDKNSLGRGVLYGWKPFGDVFKAVETVEKDVIDLENLTLRDGGEENLLLAAQENILLAIDRQEQFLSQKASISHFKEGDRNTKFYHAYIKYRRQHNTIHKIHNSNGNWIFDNSSIATDVIAHFQQILTQPDLQRSPIENLYSIEEINNISKLNLTSPPKENEILQALQGIEGSKTAGPDGFTSDFYKKAWEIIKNEVITVVESFFQ
ncbi:uncharacterized protein LOC110039102, partial [Phalaenopsis equestris]|uniref:uncharacterized protein LOC110039102 n=1 Tax=Phalaenopsis equestris TaxID=78828 RepID=UPI0009E1A65F